MIIVKFFKFCKYCSHHSQFVVYTNDGNKVVVKCKTCNVKEVYTLEKN